MPDPCIVGRLHECTLKFLKSQLVQTGMEHCNLEVLTWFEGSRGGCNDTEKTLRNENCTCVPDIPKKPPYPPPLSLSVCVLSNKQQIKNPLYKTKNLLHFCEFLMLKMK